MSEIGKRIREIRSEKKITQTEMAGLLNVDRSTISKWENGQNMISAEDLKRISDALTVPLDSFFGETGGNTDKHHKGFQVNITEETAKQLVSHMIVIGTWIVGVLLSPWGFFVALAGEIYAVWKRLSWIEILIGFLVLFYLGYVLWFCLGFIPPDMKVGYY